MARKKKGNDNVTIDLGEAIERRLASASGRAGRGRPGRPMGRYRPNLGSYRGGYTGGWALGDKMGLPRSVETKQLVTGAVLGALANRALYRGIPMLISTESKLVVDGIAFGAGLIPFLVKKNAFNVGLALPGFVFLVGSVADYALNMVGMEEPKLSGSSPKGIAGRGASARERLAHIGQRIHAQRGGVQGRVRVPA